MIIMKKIGKTLLVVIAFAFAISFSSCEKMDVQPVEAGSDLSSSVQMTGSDLSSSVQMTGSSSELSGSVQ